MDYIFKRAQARTVSLWSKDQHHTQQTQEADNSLQTTDRLAIKIIAFAFSYSLIVFFLKGNVPLIQSYD